MTELMKKERDFVVPGDEIIRSMDYLPGRNCFREGDSILTKRLGLVHIDNRVISVIPLSGVYIPKVGDMVIGEIQEIQNSGWVVDIKSVTSAFMPLSGVREFIDANRAKMSRHYDIGDTIYAKIHMVNGNSVHLSMQDPRARKLTTGRIVKMSPAKVPRVIGKQGSMISTLKSKTGCRISVGQNGLIWIDGEKIDIVIDIIETIEKESHLEGLTDRVSGLLDQKLKEMGGKT